MLAYRGYENISNVNGAHSAIERNVHRMHVIMLYRDVRNIHLCVLCTYHPPIYTNSAKLHSRCEALMMLITTTWHCRHLNSASCTT